MQADVAAGPGAQKCCTRRHKVPGVSEMPNGDTPVVLIVDTQVNHIIKQ
jgi:hypothetical protein